MLVVLPKRVADSEGWRDEVNVDGRMLLTGHLTLQLAGRYRVVVMEAFANELAFRLIEALLRPSSLIFGALLLLAVGTGLAARVSLLLEQPGYPCTLRARTRPTRRRSQWSNLTPRCLARSRAR